MDRLTDMRANTNSSRAADVLESGWRQDYRVEIPRTGIVIGEIRTALRRWLGSDVHVGGEVYLTRDGMVLTVRTDKGSSATFTGKEGEIDLLAEKAAEDIYTKTAPYLHAIYLQYKGKGAESQAALRHLSETATDDSERAWALSALGLATYALEGRCDDAILILERAIALDPRLPNPVANLAMAHSCLGHDQITADLRRKLVALWQEGGVHNPARIKTNRLESEMDEAELIGDFRRVLDLNAQLEGEGAGSQTIYVAAVLALMRDVSASKRMLSQFRADAFTDLRRFSYWHAKSLQAKAIEDWSSEARYAEKAMRVTERLDRFARRLIAIQYNTIWAGALARAGNLLAADALLRDLPSDCYPCARGNGMVADVKGDHAAADRWFAHAVRLGPRLPSAYQEWGDAKLRRKDAGGALLLFERSLAFGPEFPDALKGKANALARLGRDEEAERAYQDTADRAPRWGALQIDWGLALWRLNRREEARAKFRAAAGMDLGVADRARLKRIWTAANGRAI